MNIDQCLKRLSLAAREELAEDVGTTGRYLSRIAYGRMQVLPGPKLARKLVAHQMLEGKTTLAETRPDIWGEDAA